MVMNLFGRGYLDRTYTEISMLCRVFQGHFTHTNSTLLTGKVVGGIDYYLIDIASLIFGYGIYKLVSQTLIHASERRPTFGATC